MRAKVAPGKHNFLLSLRVKARMKQLILLLSLFLFAPGLAWLGAQSYDLAFGMRLGTEWGVTGKLRLPPLDENFTIETIIQSSIQREEAMITLLAAQNFPLITRRINLYAGAGVHKGWITPGPDEPAVDDPLGVSFVLGGEMTLGRLNVSYDFKPAINLSGGAQRVYAQTAVSLRYVAFKRFDIFERPGKRRREKRRRERERNGNDGGNWRFWEKD